MADIDSTRDVNSPLVRGMSSLTCLIAGGIFLILAIWGFFLPQGGYVLGLFAVNAMQNWVHLLSGLILLAAGFSDNRSAAVALVVFGAIYGLITIMGFAGVPWIVNMLNLNHADHWLHLLLTAAFLTVGITDLSSRTGTTSSVYGGRNNPPPLSR